MPGMPACLSLIFCSITLPYKTSPLMQTDVSFWDSTFITLWRAARVIMHTSFSGAVSQSVCSLEEEKRSWFSQWHINQGRSSEYHTHTHTHTHKHTQLKTIPCGHLLVLLVFSFLLQWETRISENRSLECTSLSSFLTVMCPSLELLKLMPFNFCNKRSCIIHV